MDCLFNKFSHRDIKTRAIAPVTGLVLGLSLVLALIPQAWANTKIAVEPGQSHTALDSLNKALVKFDSNAAISGKLKIAFKNRRGEGKKLKKTEGSAALYLTHDKSGLVTTYSTDLIKQIAIETEANIVDETAKTPTLDAINGTGMSSLMRTLSPADSVRKLLKNARLKAVETLSGKDDADRTVITKRLHFSLPMEAIIDDKETREYVKDFSGSLIIETDETGVPVLLKTKFDGRGRAYVFFKVAASGNTTQHFEIINNRLVLVDREVFAKFETTFGDGESYDRIEFIPNNPALSNE
jgi:hypothetical protein